MNAETILTRNIKIAINRTGRARLIRNNVGFSLEAKLRYGLGLGSPDLVGCLIGSGRVFALEVKTPTGRVTTEQLAWMRACRGLGGFVCVVRSVEEALLALDRACNMESE